ncbi:MAG: GlsB/YeaQ/YmgE family stress response membrane protein [Verrucomicrobiaceae bacterium]|nr:MAG: GlsB/YeaQ/YmgE family stress response membrane protein [Verrucomicrobiaceae bacterium]
MLDQGLIGTLVIGLIVGAIAKFLMPGKDPGGCIITILLGIAGAFIGTFLGRLLWGGQNYVAGWITSIIGAMILLFIYRMIVGRRGGGPRV